MRMICEVKKCENLTEYRRLFSNSIEPPSLVGSSVSLGLGVYEECLTITAEVTRWSNFIHNLSFCLAVQFIAVKRNPNVLNTSGATSTSASQSSGESSASQDKGIGGPKIIALAAENSNLKNLLAEVRHESFFSRKIQPHILLFIKWYSHTVRLFS